MTDHRQVTVTLDREAAEEARRHIAETHGYFEPDKCSLCRAEAALRTALQEGEGEAVGFDCVDCGKPVGPDGHVSVEYRELGGGVASAEGQCADCLKADQTRNPERYGLPTHPHDQEAPQVSSGDELSAREELIEREDDNRKIEDERVSSGDGEKDSDGTGRMVSADQYIGEVIGHMQERRKYGRRRWGLFRRREGEPSGWQVGNGEGWTDEECERVQVIEVLNADRPSPRPSTLTDEERERLEEILETLENKGSDDCSFWACGGPEVETEIVPMKTCARCQGVIELRAFLRTLAGKEQR